MTLQRYWFWRQPVKGIETLCEPIWRGCRLRWRPISVMNALGPNALAYGLAVLFSNCTRLRMGCVWRVGLWWRGRLINAIV